VEVERLKEEDEEEEQSPSAGSGWTSFVGCPQRRSSAKEKVHRGKSGEMERLQVTGKV
jgi:hypothetical protein